MGGVVPDGVRVVVAVHAELAILLSVALGHLQDVREVSGDLDGELDGALGHAVVTDLDALTMPPPRRRSSRTSIASCGSSGPSGLGPGRRTRTVAAQVSASTASLDTQTAVGCLLSP